MTDLEALETPLVGPAFKAIRVALGVTRELLCSRIRVDPKTLVYWEKQEARPIREAWRQALLELARNPPPKKVPKRHRYLA